MNDLKYFEGKFCSIFTVPHSRDLYREGPESYPSTVYRYFVGQIETIDRSAVVLKQVSKNLRTYIPFQHIVAIAEEEILDPNNPEDAKVINETFGTKAFEGDLVNPEAITDLADNLKQNFGQ